MRSNCDKVQPADVKLWSHLDFFECVERSGGVVRSAILLYLVSCLWILLLIGLCVSLCVSRSVCVWGEGCLCVCVSVCVLCACVYSTCVVF